MIEGILFAIFVVVVLGGSAVFILNPGRGKWWNDT